MSLPDASHFIIDGDAATRIPRRNARRHAPQESQFLSCRGNVFNDSVKCR